MWTKEKHWTNSFVLFRLFCLFIQTVLVWVLIWDEMKRKQKMKLEPTYRMFFLLFFNTKLLELFLYRIVYNGNTTYRSEISNVNILSTITSELGSMKDINLEEITLFVFLCLFNPFKRQFRIIQLNWSKKCVPRLPTEFDEDGNSQSRMWQLPNNVFPSDVFSDAFPQFNATRSINNLYDGNQQQKNRIFFAPKNISFSFMIFP